MKKIFKWILAAGTVLCLLGVVVGVVALRKMDELAKSGTERVMSYVLDVPVTLEGASLKPWRGAATLRGLKVANPEGFHTDSALLAGEITIKLDLGSFRTDTILIEHIKIGGPKVTLEQGLRHSNLGDLVRNAQRLTAGGDMGKNSGGEDKPEAETAGKKVRVTLIQLDDAQVALSAPILKGRDVTFPLGDFRIEDDGNAETRTVAEMVQVFLERVLTQSLEKGGNAIPQDFQGILQGDLGSVREKLGKRIGVFREGVKGLLGR